MIASYRFNLNSIVDVVRKLTPEIIQLLDAPDKQADIVWALKELLGNVRHAPTKLGLVELEDDGGLTLTNCAIGKASTLEEQHGLGFGIARSLGAVIELGFIQTEYGCWRAITKIDWDFEVIGQPIEIDLSSIDY
jgi:hypothetical protein